MNSSKPMTGAEVKGYKTLGPAAIEDMNNIKDCSRAFMKLLDRQRGHVYAELCETANMSQEAHEASRCIEIAREKMQEACMWACRAVARPDPDC